MLEYIKSGQNVYFSVCSHTPSGGALTIADVTPKYYVDSKNGSTISRIINGYSMQPSPYFSGKYDGYFYTSGTMFNAGTYYEVSVSGAVLGLTDVIPVKTFVLEDTFNANVVQTSGNAISPFFGQDIYYCNIKMNKDATNSRDEYVFNWFKNGTPLSSGSISNPAVSIYNTSDGSSFITNQQLTFASVNLGVLRYNSTSLLPSGETYLVVTSGTIDSSTRTWQNLVGVDAL